MTKDSLKDRIVGYLEGHNAMSLATVDMDQPHAASVFYVNRLFDLYFVTSPTSRHGQDIAANNRVFATINEDYANWGDIRGLQLQGRVEQLGPLSEDTEIVGAFTRKFPDASGFFQPPDRLPADIAEKVEGVRFYRFLPSRIYYIDNSLGFGHREEFLPDNGGKTEGSP